MICWISFLVEIVEIHFLFSRYSSWPQPEGELINVVLYLDYDGLFSIARLVVFA